MDLNLLNKLCEITNKYDNNKCADCSVECITCVNCHFKVTLCDQCAMVHQSLPNHANDVKSLRHDPWESLHDIAILESVNNRTLNDELLQTVPTHYDLLTHDSIFIWRKYFIHAKYAYKKFTFNKSSQNCQDLLVKEGVLMKRAKADDKFRERYFVLRENGWLLYYQDSKIHGEPKRIIQIGKLDLHFVPDKMDVDTGLQLSFTDNNSVHDIYVYSDDVFEIMDWYNTIKAAKFKILRKEFLCHDEKTLLKMLSANIIKEGFMVKSGGKPHNSMRKRWFTLIEIPLFLYTKWVLRYYEYPLDCQPLGEIYIGKYSDGYQIDLCKTFTGRKSDDKTFTLVSKSRSYDLIAETPDERESWIKTLEIALSR